MCKSVYNHRNVSCQLYLVSTFKQINDSLITESLLLCIYIWTNHTETLLYVMLDNHCYTEHQVITVIMHINNKLKNFLMAFAPHNSVCMKLSVTDNNTS